MGTCKPAGDLDLLTAAVFAASLRSIIDDADEAVVTVDCAQVTFMDSAAYHALATATSYAARRGHTLILRNLSAADAKLLHLCDFDRALRVERSSVHRAER